VAGDHARFAGDLRKVTGDPLLVAGDLVWVAGDLGLVAGDLGLVAGDLTSVAGDHRLVTKCLREIGAQLSTSRPNDLTSAEATSRWSVANPHLSTTLAEFEARVQRHKNRLIAIPADVQRALRLGRRANNHIVLYSIRRKGQGRWNHHLAYLTQDNEFAVPSDVQHIQPGSEVEVKIRRVIPDVDALAARDVAVSAGALLTALSAAAGEDERVDGSEHVDDYLYSGSPHA
jgi:hypothetical protein